MQLLQNSQQGTVGHPPSVLADSLEAEEEVLGLFALPAGNAETIFCALKDVLLRNGLQLSDCRAACFDGAAAFMGKKSGVGNRLKEEEERIDVQQCSMHAVNLAVQDSVMEVNQFAQLHVTRW